MRQRLSRATAPPEWQAHDDSPLTTWSTFEQQRTNNSPNHDNYPNQDEHDHNDVVVDLSNAHFDNKKEDNDEDDVQVVTEWSCPQCTLLNPMNQNECSVCQYTRERPADPVRRDRLVRDDSHPQFLPSSPGSFVGGGALLGSVIGAAGAYMQGNSLGSGVLEGAMTGAMGGAVADSLFRSSQQAPVASSQSNSHHHHQQQQQYRDQYSYQQPRSSFRVSVGSDMPTTTTTMIRGPRGSSYRTARGGDPLLALMMANMLNARDATHGIGGADIDGMSYEQLLQAFGDGSENRGADEGAIASLPTSRITKENADCENADHAKCSICLEMFTTGDSKKMLPCLHGFHSQCVDRWLRSNRSCPICKHQIS
jgi:hypothetical protein